MGAQLQCEITEVVKFQAYIQTIYRVPTLGNVSARVHFTNIDELTFGNGEVISPIVLYGMYLLIHALTSTAV